MTTVAVPGIVFASPVAPPIPAEVLEHLEQAMSGLGMEEDANNDEEHDPLDDPDLSWEGGRYDHEAQRIFILKLVLHFSGYKHDPKLSQEDRREERMRILRHPDTQHRRIFQTWPLSEEVKKDFKFNPPLHNYPGLASPNTPAIWSGPGMWGATLFDHYNIFPTPSDIGGLALFPATGSKMLKWALASGDTFAAPQMAWAITEPKPEIIEPCDIGGLIETNENRRRMFFGIASAVTPPLQEYLPQHLLPESLTVYDPEKLLYTSKSKGSSTQHRYKLKLSEQYDKRRAQDVALEDEAAANANKILEDFLADPHTRNSQPSGQIISILPADFEEAEGPAQQKIFYIHPPMPGRTPLKDAQLRLSKNQFLGSGNHSFVYDAHFVLPRSAFFKPQLCAQCISDDIQQQVYEYPFPPAFFQDTPGKMVYTEEPVPVKSHFSATKPAPLPRMHKVLRYQGPFIAFQSTVKYSHEPCAKHQSNMRRPPSLAEVRVVAKISKDNDAHLAHEADNYQQFPRYLFEHWSGLILVPGIRNPVPAAPVVPQFYGYYVPDVDGAPVDSEDQTSPGNGTPKDNSNDKAASEPFLSPILLVENCGTPIDPEEYGHDDIQECCALVYRLKYAGFVHGSVAERNILAQQGPLSAWPLERSLMPGSAEFNITNEYGGPSGQCFRLIDFGRTEHVSSLTTLELNTLIRKDDDVLKEWGNTREGPNHNRF